MKLKNLLIICMIFALFMAAAVSPAVAADFDAEVSMKTDFNEAINLMPSTKDVDATPDDMDINYDPPADLGMWDGKAVVSEDSRKVHVAVTGYSRNIKSSDIVLEYYNEDGGLLSLNAQIAPQGFKNASSSGCDFTLPTLYDEDDWLDWIRVTVKDQDGQNPVFAWVEARVKNLEKENLDTDATFVPDVKSWDDADVDKLFLCNSVNVTLLSSNINTQPLYLWWRESKGTVRAESTELDTTTDLTIFPQASWDPNFSILYTNSSYQTPEKIKVYTGTGSVNYLTKFDNEIGNLFTGYNEAGPDYYLYVPDCKDLTQVQLQDATVDYMGQIIDVASVAASQKIGDYNYFRLTLDDDDLADALDYFGIEDELSEVWTYNNSKVVFEKMITEGVNDNLYVAGPVDGVGPRLINAAISYNDAKKLTLTFSEPLKASVINTAKLQSALWIGDPGDTYNITNASVDSKEPNKIFLTISSDVEIGEDVNFDIDDATTDAVQDLSGNPSYELTAAVPTSIERTVDRVEVTGVTRTGDPDDDGIFPGSTSINVYFDESMLPAAADTEVEDVASYVVELKPGLVESDDPDLKGTAEITDADYTDDGDNHFVKLTVNGVISSTDEADLPGVKIVEDIVGGPHDSPIASEFRNVFLEANDEIGPYLTSASFSLNPVTGDTSTDLIEANKAKLTLNFSENVLDENLRPDTFIGISAPAVVPAFNSDFIENASISGYGTSTLVLTIDDDVRNVPFNPGDIDYTITFKLTNNTDIEDKNGNFLSDTALLGIDILDTTPVWVESSIITNDEDFIYIDCVFGKEVIIDAEITNEDNEYERIKVNGDPDIISDVDYTPGTRTLRLTIDATADKATNWMPTVFFDLAADNVIEDSHAAEEYTANDLTTDFSIVPDDGMPARIKNADVDNKVYAYQTGQTLSDDAQFDYRYTIEVPFEFTEPINSEIWAAPGNANRYVRVECVNFAEVDSFVITGNYSCSGNRLTVKIISDVTVDDANPLIQVYFDDVPPIVDLNKIESDLYDGGAPKYTLKQGTVTDKWSTPEDAQDIAVGKSFMKIWGYVKDATGDEVEGAGTDAVYAFSVERLYRVSRDPSTDVVDEVGYAYDVSHDRCYGAGSVNADGSYYMNVYGADNKGLNGFKANESIILIYYNDDGDSVIDAGDQHFISSTAYANSPYSIKFEAPQVPKIKQYNIELGKRESIRVNPGWNLISTSIGNSVYVAPDVCAQVGLNPSDLQGYIYGPDDALTDPGFMPSDAYTLSSRPYQDISALLFTLAQGDLENSILAPYGYSFLPDRLDDTLNINIPVFGPGLGFYIYLDPEIADLDSEWQVVLFGEKIPSPEYKVKVPNNVAIIGHWGNLTYHTERGYTNAQRLEADSLLPSTYRGYLNVDDIASGIATNAAAEFFALTVTNAAGNTFDVDLVSTFYNYTFNNGDTLIRPAVWWGDSEHIDFSDLDILSPGNGSLIVINGPENGPYFINYLSE